MHQRTFMFHSSNGSNGKDEASGRDKPLDPYEFPHPKWMGEGPATGIDPRHISPLYEQKSTPSEGILFQDWRSFSDAVFFGEEKKC